jgi:hypothetical protein
VSGSVVGGLERDLVALLDFNGFITCLVTLNCLPLLAANIGCAFVATIEGLRIADSLSIVLKNDVDTTVMKMREHVEQGSILNNWMGPGNNSMLLAFFRGYTSLVMGIQLAAAKHFERTYYIQLLMSIL